VLNVQRRFSAEMMSCVLDEVGNLKSPTPTDKGQP